MSKYKDSDCYPIMFDLRALISADEDLVFPMVWRDKYYLKKALEIHKNNVFILGLNLKLEENDD